MRRLDNPFTSVTLCIVVLSAASRKQNGTAECGNTQLPLTTPVEQATGGASYGIDRAHFVQPASTATLSHPLRIPHESRSAQPERDDLVKRPNHNRGPPPQLALRKRKARQLTLTGESAVAVILSGWPVNFLAETRTSQAHNMVDQTVECEQG